MPSLFGFFFMFFSMPMPIAATMKHPMMIVISIPMTAMLILHKDDRYNNLFYKLNKIIPPNILICAVLLLRTKRIELTNLLIGGKRYAAFPPKTKPAQAEAIEKGA